MTPTTSGNDHLQLIKFWSSRAPGKGVCGEAKISGSALLQPARSVCVSLSAFFVTKYYVTSRLGAHRLEPPTSCCLSEVFKNAYLIIWLQNTNFKRFLAKYFIRKLWCDVAGLRKSKEFQGTSAPHTVFVILSIVRLHCVHMRKLPWRQTALTSKPTDLWICYSYGQNRIRKFNKLHFGFLSQLSPTVLNGVVSTKKRFCPSDL